MQTENFAKIHESSRFRPNLYQLFSHFKGDSNPNDTYVLSERTLGTMNFDTSIIKIGWKMEKSWAFKELNMDNIKPPFWIFN